MQISDQTPTKDIAAILNKRQYGKEVTKEECAAMKLRRVIVLFGASDDNIEIDGFECEEVGAYGDDGGTIHFDQGGLVKNECEDENCPYHARRLEASGVVQVQGVYGDDGVWRFKTEIPHETFEVFDDSELFCVGIVFALDDIKEKV